MPDNQGHNYVGPHTMKYKHLHQHRQQPLKLKIYHVGLDGTKIKAKTSMNKLTNEQQLKIMKQHLEESIKLDEEEDEELGEESGNSVPKH